jgi:putative membrane protein
MRRYRSLLAAGMTLLLTLPALGQQGPAPAPPVPPYAYGHMWHGGWGWHPGMMLFVCFVMVVGLVAAVLLVLCLARGFGACHRWHHHGRYRGSTALDILEERFAKGEIGKEEFEEKRKLLGR